MILAAVVVTFNRLDKLKITLESLMAEEVDHIVVADNASSDGTASWLAGLTDPRLHVVTLDDNLGGAGGFEAGMAAARASFDPDWIVLMDDDARPYPGALSLFREKSITLGSDTGAVAAAVFYPDKTLCEMNRPSRNPFWNLVIFFKTLAHGSRSGFHIDDSGFAPDADACKIDVASFVGYFVHRTAMDRAGLPEGGLFIYGDDVLYSLRLRRMGIEITFLPAIRFEHDCGTMGEGFIYRPLWKIYYHCRNGVSIARQAAGPIVFPLALAYYTVIWWRRGKRYNKDERATYKRLMWQGLRDGLRNKRGRNDALHM